MTAPMESAISTKTAGVPPEMVTIKANKLPKPARDILTEQAA